MWKELIKGMGIYAWSYHASNQITLYVTEYKIIYFKILVPKNNVQFYRNLKKKDKLVIH